MATINQVAEYYEVGQRAVLHILERHEGEFEEDNVNIIKGSELADIKGKIKGNEQLGRNLYDKLKYSRQLTVFPRRAVLRVGMLLRDSEVELLLFLKKYILKGEYR